MKTDCCCNATEGATRGQDNPARPPSRRRRLGEFAGWLFPTATLVLMPKCPVCLAAYVALFSGMGISIASASILRTALLTLCIVTLLGLAVWRLRRLVFRRG